MEAAPEVARPDPKRPAPIHFEFASGARPLAGYTIRRGVGTGGFGEVYYATSDAGKDVALKLVRRNLDVELRGVRQCLNVKHPNLLVLYDVRQDEQGNSWVVMEYVSGERLETCIARHPQGLPVDEALAWFRGVVAAVAHLHEHGIVHRDLKPGNIFREQGVVKLGDYGLSKFISVSRRSGQTESIGTVHYMAPEIAKGCYGKEIDIYALGVLLYELLSGRVPFEGQSVAEVLMKHLTSQPDLSPLAEPYRSVVAACLAKDPEDRPQSAGELLARLDGVSQSVGETGRAGPRASPRPVSQVPAAENVWQPIVWLRSLSTPSKVLLAITLPLVLWTSGHALRHPAADWIRGLPPSRALALLVASAFVYGFLRRRDKPRATSGHKVRIEEPSARPVEGPATNRPQTASKVIQIPVRVVEPSSNMSRPSAITPVRSPREQLSDLLGSMVFAAAVAAALVVLAAAVRGGQPSTQRLLWQWLASTAGSWIVLVPAKCWEGKPGDDSRRRFVMLLLGLGLGGFACGVAQYLWVDLPYHSPIVRVVGPTVPPAAFEANGQPRLLAYLAYFGLLMLVPRWWMQADPRRKRRINLWSTALCLVWALVLNGFCAFPQPWALTIAGSMSLSVQLASGWRRRIEPREGKS